jgi:hypothetical protein
MQKVVITAAQSAASPSAPPPLVASPSLATYGEHLRHLICKMGPGLAARALRAVGAVPYRQCSRHGRAAASGAALAEHGRALGKKPAQVPGQAMA